MVVTDDNVIELDTDSYTVHAKRAGESNITLELNPTGSLVTTVSVEVTPVEIQKLDPIVGTLRLSLDSIPQSRLEQGLVTLQVLDGVLFAQEKAVVTASLVFKDGHRSLIPNAQELALSTSNSSVVSISEGNVLTGESEGEATITVSWINPLCGSEILTTDVMVSVVIDDTRPTFVESELTAHVPEDSPIGHNIIVVMAIVQDESGRIDDTASDVQYRFRDGFNFFGLFSLDPASGELVLNGQLDREAVESYTLYIEATDSAQRRAEQGEGEDKEQGTMGSGSGSGDGLLTPDPTPDTVNISLNIAVLTVSCTHTKQSQRYLPFSCS